MDVLRVLFVLVASIGTLTAYSCETIDRPAIPTATTPFAEALTIVLDDQPRPAIPATPAAFGGTPVQYPLWDRQSTVIYDLLTGETIDLGRSVTSGGGGEFGARVAFNDASTHAAWISADSPNVAWVIDLGSRERTIVGELEPGGFPNFDGAGRIYNLAGAVVPFSQTPQASATPAPYRPQDDSVAVVLPGYLVLTNYVGWSGSPVLTRTFTVTTTDGRTLFAFEARSVRGVGDALLVETGPADATQLPAASRTYNLFIVDVPTGASTFISTVADDHSVMANDDYIIWSEFGCTIPERGVTHVLERATGAVRRINLALRGSFMKQGTFHGVVVRGRDWSAAQMIAFNLATLKLQAVWDEYIPMQWTLDGRFGSPYLPSKGWGYCGV